MAGKQHLDSSTKFLTEVWEYHYTVKVHFSKDADKTFKDKV